jgi:F-type H+-transporting ATPase subunit b
VTRSRAAALALAAVTLAPAAARAAAEAEGHGGGGWFWHAVNLAALVAVLVYFGRAPVRAFLAERRQTIEEGIEGARRELAAAEGRLAECRQRMDTLDRELDGIRRVVREQAESERDRLLADARAAAERIRRDAAAAAEQELRHAREQLREESAELAVRLAGELLRSQVTGTDRSRLLDEFVEQVERSPGAGRS